MIKQCREFKLTRLFADSLGRNTKTIIIVAHYSSDFNFDVTIKWLSKLKSYYE